MSEKTYAASVQEFDFDQLSVDLMKNDTKGAGLREQRDHTDFHEQEAWKDRVNEFDIAAEDVFVKSMRRIILARGISRTAKVCARSARRTAHGMKLAVAFGEVAEYFTTALLAFTKAPTIGHGEQLFLGSSRMYIAVPALYQRKIYLRTNETGPYAQFTRIQYFDQNNTLLPVNDWGLIVVDGDKTYEYTLPIYAESDGFDYFGELSNMMIDEDWKKVFVK